MTLPTYLKRLPPSAILCAVLGVALAACQSDRDKAFSAYPQAVDVNSSITLEEFVELFGKAGDLKADPTPSFMLINHSSESVTLPDDFGTRIFTYSAGSRSWTEIQNGTTYSPAGVPEVLAPASEPPFNEEVVDPWPIGESLDSASHLRVMVSGNLAGDDGEMGEELVAYVEIELQH